MFMPLHHHSILDSASDFYLVVGVILLLLFGERRDYVNVEGVYTQALKMREKG